MSVEDYIRQKISDILTKTGLSASELGRRSKHGKSYISNILSGNSLPTFDSLAEICKAAGISLSDFFVDYEPGNDELVVEIKRLFTLDEEKKLSALLKKADRESAELLLQVIEHISHKA